MVLVGISIVPKFSVVTDEVIPTPNVRPAPTSPSLKYCATSPDTNLSFLGVNVNSFSNLTTDDPNVFNHLTSDDQKAF